VYDIIGTLLLRWGVEEPTLKDRKTLFGGVNGSLQRHDGKIVTNDGARPARWSLKG
jgi:hypothetical protein